MSIDYAYSLSGMKILTTFKIFTKWIKLAFLFPLRLQFVLQTFAVLMSAWLILLGLTILCTFSLFIALRLLSLNPHTLALRLFLDSFGLFLRYIIPLLLSLLPLFLILLGFLSQLLSSACNELLDFLFLTLFLIFLSTLCSLELFRLGLPLHHLRSNDIDSLLILNTRRDVFLEFIGISLSVQICIEQHPEISS